jgi:hypothetical protein
MGHSRFAIRVDECNIARSAIKQAEMAHWRSGHLACALTDAGWRDSTEPIAH